MERGQCPFSNYQLELLDDNKITKESSNNGTSTDQNGINISYSQYLQLDKLLSCQKLLSEESGNIVNDEHLFITTHQVYELWFKQINFDIDNIMAYFKNKIVDETKTLRIVSGLERTVRILKLLVDQMLILETISPLDFLEFRKHLKSASGFQSAQFRILENKLGIMPEKRINYNSQHYTAVFKNEQERLMIQLSEDTPSLLSLVEKWLERTPGVQSYCGRPGFWSIYVNAVEMYLEDLKTKCEKPGLSIEMSDEYYAEYIKIKNSFNSLLDVQQHNSYVSKGGRRLSHDAMKGALMIYFYREIPRFSQPYQILTYLMDLDSLLTKWRYNHVMLVQRMLGSKQGTGGSSGYMYLRSTVSDRYKVFLDLFNLSTWLIPRAYIPTLSPTTIKQLSDCSAAEDDVISSNSE